MTCFHLPFPPLFPPRMFPPQGGDTCPENRQNGVSTFSVSTSFPPKMGGGNKVETHSISNTYAPCFHLLSFIGKKREKRGLGKDTRVRARVETRPASVLPQPARLISGREQAHG